MGVSVTVSVVIEGTDCLLHVHRHWSLRSKAVIVFLLQITREASRAMCALAVGVCPLLARACACERLARLEKHAVCVDCAFGEKHAVCVDCAFGEKHAVCVDCAFGEKHAVCADCASGEKHAVCVDCAFGEKHAVCADCASGEKHAVCVDCALEDCPAANKYCMQSVNID